MEGWIKLYRKMLDWEWYKDVNTKSLFLHLLLTANTKDGEWKGVPIRRGQVATSLSSLARELGMTIQNVRTSLAKLKLTRNLTSESTNKLTIITICKFEDYQDLQQANQQAEQHATQQQTNNKQEDKKKEYINSLKKETPKGVKKENLSSSPKAPKPSPQPLSLPYNSPRFVEVWETLRIQPKWKGKTQTALQLSLNKLARYDEAFSISLMEDAIERNWQGVVFGDTDERYRQWKTGGKKPKPTKLDQYREVAIQLGLINGTDESNTVDEQ